MSKFTKKEFIEKYGDNKTDLERFLELYRSVGIEPEINPGDSSDFDHIKPSFDGGTVLVLSSGTAENTDGYPFFFTAIDFDNNGKFIKQGFWE